ncbi:hypothetical protein [Kineococcus sp. SYSU DK004]|uniref:hypothetical protein n=1 Tax=Kineococcus sp. SYSU DK004 TaxID=3383125 RepID=UPI003D7EAD0A
MSDDRSTSHARRLARTWVQAQASHHLGDYELVVEACREMDRLDLGEHQRVAFYEVAWDVVAARRAARVRGGALLPRQHHPLSRPVTAPRP